ncbi:hypothetical protein BX070DRAFT_58665 [Coemansia spiralis]|nr:hypothetical protein BX070DRAFT_58665 [Coemansia spiralis]
MENPYATHHPPFSLLDTISLPQVYAFIHINYTSAHKINNIEMVKSYKVALALVASIGLALAAPTTNGIQERALLPALLGNLELAVSACPDVNVNGPGGGSGCGSVQRTAVPESQTPAPTGPPYNNAPAPLPPAPTSSVPAPSNPTPAPSNPAPAPAPAPAPSSPAPAPSMPAPAPSSSMPAPSMPAPAPSSPAPAPSSPAPAPSKPAPSSTCTK